MNDQFGWMNWIVIVLYLAVLACIGAYFSRRQRNLEDYFLAGRGMGWLPVGMSLMAALNSGIDYMMKPFEAFTYGLIFIVQICSWLVLYPWVAQVTMPFYRRLQLISAYEYLEQRFNSPVRTLAAGIYLLWRIGWMATAVYAPSLAISRLTGAPLTPTILGLGSAVTCYTMLGGITAIIWTDVLQFCVMLAGVAATLAVIFTSTPGGAAGVWAFAAAHGRTAVVALPDSNDWASRISFLLTSEMSVLGIVLASVVGRMTTYTCEQSTIQRFQATRSLNDAKRAFIVNAVGDTSWTVGLLFVGLGLFAFFRGQPPTDAHGNVVRQDQLIIFFMNAQFPLLSGLVVAAVLASGLSAIDAAINAGTSVVMVDFYNRLYRRVSSHSESLTPQEQQQQVRVSRVVTVLFAIVGLTLAMNVDKLGANLLQIAHRVIQTPTGPLLGMFLLGMFSRLATSKGTFVGGATGLAVALYVAFGTNIGFIWPTVFGLVSTVVPAYVVSLFTTTSAPDARPPLTWLAVMRGSSESAAATF